MKKFGTTSATLVNKYEHKVFITNAAWRAMTLYTEACTKEIGWLGFATRSETEPLHITINDVVLPNQQVHSTTTEIQPEHMMALYDDWSKLYDPITAGQMFDKINVWGHSHVNMSPSPSGQDDSTFKTFIDGGKPFFVRLIMNKTGEVAIDVADMEYNVLTKYADVSIIIPENTVDVHYFEEVAHEDIAEFIPQGSSVILTNMGKEIILVDTKHNIVFRNVSLDHAQPYTDILKAQIESEVKTRVKDIVYNTRPATVAYGTPAWYEKYKDEYDIGYGGRNVMTTPSTGGTEKPPTKEELDAEEEKELSRLDIIEQEEQNVATCYNILSALLMSNALVGKCETVGVTNAALVHLVAYNLSEFVNLEKRPGTVFLLNTMIARLKKLGITVHEEEDLTNVIDSVLTVIDNCEGWRDYFLLNSVKVASTDPALLSFFLYMVDDFEHYMIYETIRANQHLYAGYDNYTTLKTTMVKELVC